jgi:hypothetical protein
MPRPASDAMSNSFNQAADVREFEIGHRGTVTVSPSVVSDRKPV